MSSEFFDPYQEIVRHRHNLPHWQQEQVWLFVTWRLADALPHSFLDGWKEERSRWLAHHPKPWNAATEADCHRRFAVRLDEALDAGHGSCCLQDPAVRAIAIGALFHFDGQRYELATFVVMPNHVHVLFRPLGSFRLPGIIHTWKRFTVRGINKVLGQEGAFWQSDYWDRLVRTQDHFNWVTRYIQNNPRNLRESEYSLWSQ